MTMVPSKFADLPSLVPVLRKTLESPSQTLSFEFDYQFWAANNQ